MLYLLGKASWRIKAKLAIRKRVWYGKEGGAHDGDYCNVALINQCTFPLIMIFPFSPTQRSLPSRLWQAMNRIVYVFAIASFFSAPLSTSCNLQESQTRKKTREYLIKGDLLLVSILTASRGGWRRLIKRTFSIAGCRETWRSTWVVLLFNLVLFFKVFEGNYTCWSRSNAFE